MIARPDTTRVRRPVASKRRFSPAPLAVLVSCPLLVLAQLYLAITLAPVIGEALGGGGPAAAAALGTTYALAYGLGFLIFGPLSDRYGRKPVLVAGMAVLAIATAGMAVASSLSMVAVVRTVQGLVAASFSAVALAYVGEALPPRWRSTGSALCRPPSCRPAFSGRSLRRRLHRRSAGAGCSAGRAGICHCRHRHGRDLAGAASQWGAGQPGSEVS